MSTVQTPDPGVDAASTDPVSAEGLNGAVTVEGGLVTIRKGLVTRSTGIRGPSRIALRDVTTSASSHPPTRAREVWSSS